MRFVQPKSIGSIMAKTLKRAKLKVIVQIPDGSKPKKRRTFKEMRMASISMEIFNDIYESFSDSLLTEAINGSGTSLNR